MLKTEILHLNLFQWILVGLYIILHIAAVTERIRFCSLMWNTAKSVYLMCLILQTKLFWPMVPMSDTHSFILMKLERKYMFIMISELVFICINQCTDYCCYILPLLWLKHTQSLSWQTWNYQNRYINTYSVNICLFFVINSMLFQNMSFAVIENLH